MMQNRCLIIGLITLVSFCSFSQDVFRVGGGREFLRAKEVKSSKVGDIYVDTAWLKTEVTVAKSDKPESVFARYELRGNQLEVKTSYGVGVLDARVIESYTFEKSGQRHEFINANTFTLEGAPLVGMLEVLSLGKMALYKRYSYYVKMPDYNAALAVGNTNEQLFIENELYYSVGKALVKVPSKKKKLLEVFGDKTSEVEGFINQNKLSVSKESELVSVFNFYNAL